MVVALTAAVTCLLSVSNLLQLSRRSSPTVAVVLKKVQLLASVMVEAVSAGNQPFSSGAKRTLPLCHA